MRLLNVHTLVLQNFRPADIPKYVIASHRWVDGGEMMMKDVQKNRHTDSSGYKKLQGFAKFVRESLSGIDWIWVDACCIDQKSDREVSEAINSMFKWYSNADVCLAWLADVIDAQDEVEFGNSSWFSRGWTLQELLAPSVVVFLSRDWEVIGHKGGQGLTRTGLQVSRRALEPVVATITGIPEPILHDFNESKDLSPEARLAWIVHRNTTYEEDMSYSLLGIFNVTMPLIYGEGAERARKRLLDETYKISVSSSSGLTGQFGRIQVLDPAMRQPTHNIPFPQDPDFVERAGMLERINDKLFNGTRRTALVGLGGVGKSQLAIECGYRLRKRSPHTWVFWIHTSNIGRFEQSIRDIADLVDMPDREKTDMSTSSNLTHGDWLAILDNADDVNFLIEKTPARNTASSRPTVFECVPTCEHGSILITSRSHSAARQLVGPAEILDIDSMARVEAAELLRKKLGDYSNESDLVELATALEYMPLAMTQASAYINQRGQKCSVQQYLQKLEESDESRGRLLAREIDNVWRDRDAKNSITLTWQISFDHIRQTRPSAADLLGIMSFCDCSAIPESLLRSRDDSSPHRDGLGEGLENTNGEATIDAMSLTSSDDEFQDNLDVLLNYSFISTCTGSSSDLEMHRLVRIATHQWLEHHDHFHTQYERFIAKLYATFPDGTPENWERCQTLYPHAWSAFKQKPKSRKALLQWISVIRRAACYANNKGGTAFWSQAELLQTENVKTCQDVLGEDHPKTLANAADLATIYFSQGRWNESESLATTLVELSSRVLGEEHANTVLAMKLLAEVYGSQGRYRNAEQLQVRTVEMSKRVFGKESPTTLQCIGNLAATLECQGRWYEAEELLTDIIETSERLWGRESRTGLYLRLKLARVYYKQGRWGVAEEILFETSEIAKRIFGEEHPDTLASLNDLALVYWNIGRFEKAEKLQIKVLEMTRRVRGEEHPEALTCIGNLALTYGSLGRWDDKEELEVNVIEMSKRILGEDHTYTLIRMENLSFTLYDQGRKVAALTLLEDCVTVSARTRGEAHYRTIQLADTINKWRSSVQELPE